MTMTINIDSLLKLPQDAQYNLSDKHTHISVTRQGRQIVIAGRSDSIYQPMERVDTTSITGIRQDKTESTSTNKTKSNPTDSPALMLLVGVVIGITLTILKNYGNN